MCHSMYLVPHSTARTQHGTPTAMLTKISNAISGSKGLPLQTNFQMQNTEAILALVLKDSQYNFTIGLLSFLLPFLLTES